MVYESQESLWVEHHSEGVEERKAGDMSLGGDSFVTVPSSHFPRQQGQAVFQVRNTSICGAIGKMWKFCFLFFK